MFDATVYKIDDVRKREENEKIVSKVINGKRVIIKKPELLAPSW